MRELQLTGKYAEGRIAKVDDDLYEYLNQWKWWVNPHGYAVRGGWENGKSALFRLHRVVVGATKGQFVDHANLDRLDCQRHNLRICTTSQNNANSGPRRGAYKGVYYNVRSNQSRPWSAKISVEGRMIHIGYFPTAKDAAYVYDQWAIQLFGEFARTNLL